MRLLARLPRLPLRFGSLRGYSVALRFRGCGARLGGRQLGRHLAEAPFEEDDFLHRGAQQLRRRGSSFVVQPFSAALRFGHASCPSRQEGRRRVDRALGRYRILNGSVRQVFEIRQKEAGRGEPPDPPRPARSSASPPQRRPPPPGRKAPASRPAWRAPAIAFAQLPPTPKQPDASSTLPPTSCRPPNLCCRKEQAMCRAAG